MAIQIIRIPVSAPKGATDELNRLLATSRVVSLEKHWVEQGDNSYWAVWVEYIEKERKPGGAEESKELGGKAVPIDYGAALGPEELAAYAKLRAWRNQTAKAAELPAYSIFSNEQLAEMARLRITNKGGLKQIKGIGEARLEKYGDPVAAILNEAFVKSEPASAADSAQTGPSAQEPGDAQTSRPPF